MLIDDKEKFVELCIDNLLWGNLKIDLSNNDVELNKKIVKLSGDMARWIKLREEVEFMPDEFKEFTNDLYLNLLGSRFANTLQGELRDREEEAKIRELKSHNQQLAEHLSQAYIPPKDEKVGTT